MSWITTLFGLPDDYFSNYGDYAGTYSDYKAAFEANGDKSFGSMVTEVVPEVYNNIKDTISGVTRPSDVSDTADMLGTFFEYFNNLFQTEAEAAKAQAVANEEAAVNSWKRSEESAENALNRARQLRQTYYQDLYKSLEAAGLNPVLAASGGFGGVSSSAPQGTSQASSSSKAEGLNAANLLQAIAAILTGAGSLVGNLNPLKSITSIDSNGSLSRSSYSYGRR